MIHWTIFLPRMSYEKELKIKIERLEALERVYEKKTGDNGIGMNDFNYKWQFGYGDN